MQQHGSVSMFYEGAGLAVPALQWLGLRPSPILDAIPEESRQSFSRHDKSKLRVLIEYCQQHVFSSNICIFNQ